MPIFLSLGGMLVISRLFEKILPLSGKKIPAIVSSRIDLPAPVGPNITKYSLSYMSKETLLKKNSPKSFEIFSIRIIVSPSHQKTGVNPPYFSNINRETSEIIMSIVAEAMAKLSSPHDMFRYNEMGSVSVFIRVAPAIIKAAPNSPIPFDHVITEPAKMPFFAIGSVTFQKVCPSVQPSVFETCSYLGFIPSKVPRTILNM